MKSRFWQYLRLQLARMRRHLPYVLGISLLLLLAVSLYAINAANSYENDEDKLQVRIGVVGDVSDDTYVQTVLFTINNLDDAGISLRLEQMEEQEAKRLLMEGKLHSYIVFPDNFEDLYYRGAVELTYHVSPTSSGLGSALSDEIAVSMEPLFGDGQDAINSYNDYAKTIVVDNKDDEDPEELMSTAISRVILEREKMFQVDEYGIFAGQGFAGYVGISLVTFFILIWGVCCAPLFSRKNGESNRLLRSAGLGSVKQITAEFVPYALLTMTGVFSAVLLAGTVLELSSPGTLESVFFEAGSGWYFALRLALITLTFAAMHFMLYQLAQGTVAALLLQTLTAIAMGYVSGCFYSKDFFPPVLRAVGSVMPASFAIRHLSGMFPWDFLPLSGFFALFFAVSCVKRHADMAGDTL